MAVLIIIQKLDFKAENSPFIMELLFDLVFFFLNKVYLVYISDPTEQEGHSMLINVVS